MCGIAGIYNFADKKPVNRMLLEDMTNALEHRGPDGAGFFVDKNIGLGHRRLKIIDLEGGDQPIFNEDESVCIVFNGEIYNFQELKDELIKKGHTFRTNSDTEVIVHLYEDDPKGFVGRLRGMFAFAIWDARHKRVTIARDRIGQKPLYYYENSEKLLFSSELKSLLSDKSINRDISIEAFVDYLAYLAIHAPKTIYRHIKKLLPGHMLTCSPEEGIRIEEYWDFPLGKALDIDEKTAIEGLEQHLHDAVDYRMISDVPLGAFLSGGLDSSTIVSFMSRIQSEPVLTTAIGFKEEAYDESGFAKIVAEHYKTKHYTEVVSAGDLDIIEKIIDHVGEPFADPSAIPTFNLSKAIRKHVTVALSGDGGDELLAGYIRYYLDSFENGLREYIPEIVRNVILKPMLNCYPDTQSILKKGKTFLYNMTTSQPKAHFNTIVTFSDTERNSILLADIKKNLGDYHSFSMMERYYKKTEGLDDLSKILYVDMKTYFPDRMLVKVDRMSMANSLEVRAPFLDHKLIEYITLLPKIFKLKGKTGKYILKKMMEKHLPHEIIYRKKQGFDVPLDEWFRGRLKNEAGDLIFSNNAMLRELCDYTFIQKIWDEHQSCKCNWGQHLWTLYMFERWALVYHK